MTNFDDPFDEMSDDEFDEDAARLFSRPEATIALTVSVEFMEQIEALARERAGEPVHQLMVRALNLGMRQIRVEKPRPPSNLDR